MIPFILCLTALSLASKNDTKNFNKENPPMDKTNYNTVNEKSSEANNERDPKIFELLSNLVINYLKNQVSHSGYYSSNEHIRCVQSYKYGYLNGKGYMCLKVTQIQQYPVKPPFPQKPIPVMTTPSSFTPISHPNVIQNPSPIYHQYNTAPLTYSQNSDAPKNPDLMNLPYDPRHPAPMHPPYPNYYATIV